MDKLSTDDFFDDGYDAVVIGSGYGGSVAACRMSMAGYKVCLLEKGRKWEARDFPTDTLKMMSAVRMEHKNSGLSFGPTDALFQVYIQDDSLAATACGLGGGSLINAGVMLPTPVSARRHPKWPEAWEKDWDLCEAHASNMLRVQTVPTKFQNANIMEQVLSGEEYNNNLHNPIKLSFNFDIEENVSGSIRSQESGNCLACGNCLAGCPYNAKNSTDKTYLASAIQAGCTIKTECEVQYVVKNEEEGIFIKRSKRRWLVFVNEFDYIASDIVVLSGGVFGSTKILFQSQLRGLHVSDKLGSGLSCNGNSVAYLSRSSAPLNAYGLDKKQFSGIPFEQRPGPSISSSYTSSLGFSIQSAVIPTAYPTFLLKGITTYGYQTRYSFLHNVINWLKHVSGFKLSQEMVLNAIGHDDSNGKITFNKETNRIFFQPPHDHLLPRKIKAFQKIAKKLGGVLFISQYRSTSVHLLGGCIASSDGSTGVCNPNGQVFDPKKSLTEVHNGLYICDASIIPCSVGINPSLTIAAAAEHVSQRLLEDGIECIGNDNRKPGSIHSGKMAKRFNSQVMAKETMRGEVGGMPCTAYLKLRFNNLSFEFDRTESRSLLQGEVSGHVVCTSIEMDKMYIIRGEVDVCKTDFRTPYTQYMHYRLLLAASSGSRYILEGKKTMNPYLLALYAWRESTTLNVTLRKITNNVMGERSINLKGKLRISPFELMKSTCTLEGGIITRSKFILLVMKSLLRTYILQLPRGTRLSFTAVELNKGPYPNSTIHEIKTGDFAISCQHWMCCQKPKHEKKPYPVLLINGYATESYCLPTENNDLVRTLLKDGHDVWLLRPRWHWSNTSNYFSVEDIGRMDIAAAINKIIEFYGASIRVHVVAHCVGGLAIHISLMGGYVSAKHIASLSCTNSSMFFKLTTSSLVKMWLPLLPISMAIMGKNKILPMSETSATSFRHRLLKSIARLIPRYERCTCDECEVFSGIFGNVFWHENISFGMHNFQIKENLPKLPMAALPHIRKICNAGFIVDNKGNNTYLIHPERMAVPTLYISGERTLLVTPETSFLANKYMRLHQPGYRHERVVIDGFGHSDLLIGEMSHEKVFPHIQKHIKLSEDDRSFMKTPRENKYMKEALAWCTDPYEDEVNFGFLRLIAIILLVLVFKFFLY